LNPALQDVHPIVVVHDAEDAQLVKEQLKHESPSSEYVLPLTQALQPPAALGWYPALHFVHPTFATQDAADEHWLSQEMHVTPSREY
jgi:hypothetical protein